MQNKHSASELRRKAQMARKLTLQSVYEAGSGHIGGALSAIDILIYIYATQVDLNLNKNERNIFILSKGHAAPGLYACLAVENYIDRDELSTLRQIGSRLQGHPDATRLPILDAGTGALGQGLSISIGYALAKKMKGKKNRVFCMLGDGELQEGQIWEAAMYAGSQNLGNLVAIVDNNKLQNEVSVEDTLSLGDLRAKWRSFGWDVETIDGHDFSQIENSFAAETNSSPNGKPKVIIANTIKGKGVSFMEGNNQWHSRCPSSSELKQALSEIDALTLV